MNKRKLVAGNWKMNGRCGKASELIRGVASLLNPAPDVDVVFCPPFHLLAEVGQAVTGTGMQLGAQNCVANPDGAYTGDISAAMLRDANCSYVILGHSERREYHGESNAQIAAKMAAAHKVGLNVIVCVGEKDAKMAKDVRNYIVQEQVVNSLSNSATSTNTVIAYEPVWAIGTGLTPTTDDIGTMHRLIAQTLPTACKGAHILYGGSVNAKNAAEILKLPEVDGALVGGASLSKDDFVTIIRAAAP